MTDTPKVHPDGTPIQEYPKMIYHEKGFTIVHSEDEENELTGNVKPEIKSEEDKSKVKKPGWIKE